MAMTPNAQSNLALNVRVVVARKDEQGIAHIQSERRFKNTATRLMTESICNYLTGAENSYRRGKGRPNYMGFGTMGIERQNGVLDATVNADFADKNPELGQRTRPWFESTSLALTTVTGAINARPDGMSHHFWEPRNGWGKNGFTGEPSEPEGKEPIFQGELCTCMKPGEEATWAKNGWEAIERIPILRADVVSDCPADWDYGEDGYCSQAIFYAYASVEWVHKLLQPSRQIVDPKTGKVIGSEPIGPQLDRLAISEFGLYEKNNTDPHGLETMLAGFRVPSADDIVYVTDGEVILVEWRVSVRALMPYEVVKNGSGVDPDLLIPFTEADINAIIAHAERKI